MWLGLDTWDYSLLFLTLFPCYKPGSRLTLPAEPWTDMIPQNWGLHSSLENFQIRGHTLGIRGNIPCLTPSGIKDSKIIIFPQGSLLEQIPGEGLTCFLSSPKLHPSQNPFVPPVILCQLPPRVPTCLCRDLTGCGISGACGEAIRNGFWILDERAWQQLLQPFWGKHWEARS